MQPITRSDAASLLGVTAKTISRLVKLGKLTRSAGPNFTATDIADYLARNTAGPTVAAAALLRARANRLAKRALATLGQQVPVEAADALAKTVSAAVRASLTPLPGAVAPKLADLTDPAGCEATLRNALEIALNTAADTPVRWPDFEIAEVVWHESDRARIDQAKTLMLEASGRIDSGEDMPAEALGETLERRVQIARDRLLGLPVKLAPLVAVEASGEIIAGIIAQHVDEALTELS